VQNAWREREDLEIHGWVIDISTGLVKDLQVTAKSSENLGEVFKLDESRVS
jgi:carbonic anhydrase